MTFLNVQRLDRTISYAKKLYSPSDISEGIMSAALLTITDNSKFLNMAYKSELYLNV